MLGAAIVTMDAYAHDDRAFGGAGSVADLRHWFRTYDDGGGGDGRSVSLLERNSHHVYTNRNHFV